MKFKNWGRNALAAAVSTAVGLALTSCGASNTIDYMYMLSAKNNPGQVNVYKLDSQTGALTQISNSPYPAGRNPVGLVPSPNGKNLYVINHDDNTIIAYGIGTDAKLYPQHTYTTPGSEPVAITINPAGTLLFVVDFYAPNFTDLNKGYGALTVYPITTGGALGTPATQTLADGTSASYYPLGNAPSAINVLSTGNTVYVASLLTAAPPSAACGIGQGGLAALSVSSAGVLTPVSGSPYCAGVTPSAIASHPVGFQVYVTDSAQNQLIGYHVQSDGSLIPFVGGPIATGTFPDSITVEPRGLYLYVANRFSQNIQSYSIAQATGIPSSTGTYGTQTFPQCVVVEPALARFVYTADFEGDGATGYKLDPNTGMLSGNENSPYPGTGLATCLAAVSHGNHPTVHVQGVAGS